MAMIPLFKVFMSKDVGDPLLQTLYSGMITQGQKVEEFEAKLQEAFNHPWIVTLNSATSGLVMAIRMIKDELGLEEDDEVLSTNDLIRISSESLFKKPIIFNLSPAFIKLLAKVGDLFFLPLTTDRLHKLTETCVVDNSKIKSAIKKPFPTSARDGLFKTFQSFKKIQ